MRYDIGKRILFLFTMLSLTLTLEAENNDTVIFGIIPDTPPFSFVNEGGTPDGFIVELFSRIMKELDVDFTIQSGSYAEIYSGLIIGDIDFFATMIKSEMREQFFYYSDVNLSSGWGQLFINKDEKYETIQSMSNKQIGMVRGDEIGDNFILFMEQLNIPFTPVKFLTFHELKNAVRNKEIYGGVIYSSYLLGIKDIGITPTVFSPRPSYPVTGIDNDFKPTLNKISERLQELKRDENSYFYTLQSKWFGQRVNELNRFSSSILIGLLISLGASVILLLNGLILKKTIRKRTRELEQADTIFKHSIEGIMVTDKNRKIIKINKAFENITGYRKREIIGKHISILKEPDHHQEVIKEMMNSLETTGKWVGETWDRRKNGEIYPQHKSIVVIKDEKGDPLNYSFVFSDMTKNRDLENRIHYISNYDNQTDLPNKSLFNDRLIMAGMNADRENSILSVISLGIDNFKKINRSYGHLIGDEILKQVGIRLKNICRKSDTVSRYGSDEFSILLTDIITLEDIIRIVEKIKQELERPFIIEDHEIFTSCSQGISLYPSDSSDIRIIPRHSNQALHIAKKNYKGSYAFYKEEDDIVLKKRHEDETLLRSAIERNEMRVHYQPKYDIIGKRITGVEALVRWKKNNKEMIYPNDFISILEESGLIIPIGEYVLRQACLDIVELNKTLHKPLKLAVNLSGVQFSDPGLIFKMMSILEETGLPPELLEVEITESIAMHNLENTLQTLEELHKRKISIAVDDFGTGYSSLSYLKKFPLTTLKIDKSFIDDMSTNEEDQEIVKTIISLADIMNLNVVAEGVETGSQIAILEKNKCNEAQGFLISRPTDIKSLQKLLSDQH
ncbi:MAG: EAL domain-containing protein [Spirochaetaceae bacterium]|nr:EAL domain-containing protein [Spirochaetaceae bacterium]